MGKAFEKQIKTIEGQGQKKVEPLESLKQKEQTKLIEDKSNNHSKASIIFNDLINKRKEIISDSYHSVDFNNLQFDYVGPTKNVSSCECKDSKELLNALKNNWIKFSAIKNKQNEFLNKLSNTKIGKKTAEQREVIDNLNKFYKSREEVINFFRDYIEMLSDANYDSKNSETKGKGLKILTPKQMLQRLPIALAQVKAGNNSESLLNEIRQIVYSLYQSKQITKKVYNNSIKSIQWNCAQIHMRLTDAICFATYKRWIPYLWIQKTVKRLSHMF